MGGENDHAARWNLVRIFYEDHALSFKAADDEFVVDDRVADVKRRSMNLQRKADDFDRVSDPRAEPTRCGKNDPFHTLLYAPATHPIDAMP